MFQKNRNKLTQSLKNNSIAIVTCGKMKIRSNDTEYFPFRPNSNFFYLTGFNEPESILILTKRDGQSDSTILVRPKDKTMEIWTGYRLGIDDAPNKLRMNHALDISKFEKHLQEILPGIENVYFDLVNFDLLNIVSKNLDKVTSSRGNKKNIPDNFVHLPKIINLMRLKKTSFEIEQIKKACAITNLAHRQAMQKSHLCQNEREIQAMMEAIFTHHGASSTAYGTIVAGGNNGLCLHYVNNNKPLNQNDLILIDAGAEFNYYASDVTRSFPIGKTFSAEQKLIYEIVLQAQIEVIKSANSNNTLTELHNQATSIMLDGLLEFGILKGKTKTDKQEILESGQMKECYPHGTSHFMGIDVHDQNPRYINNDEVKLENGTIFTVEPGLYLYDYLDIPEKFKGIAIRIEDDILIENDRSFNLTKDIPKTVKEIEEIKESQC